MRQACKVFHSNSSYFVYFLYVLKKKRLRFCSVTFNLFLLALLFRGLCGRMYQLPVGNIEKIRKARKAVKNILSEIGLEDCQTFLQVRFNRENY